MLLEEPRGSRITLSMGEFDNLIIECELIDPPFSNTSWLNL